MVLRLPKLRLGHRPTTAGRSRSCADELERSHPGDAASLREGMEEKLTLTRLGISQTSADKLSPASALGRGLIRRVRVSARRSQIGRARAHTTTGRSGSFLSDDQGKAITHLSKLARTTRRFPQLRTQMGFRRWDSKSLLRPSGVKRQ